MNLIKKYNLYRGYKKILRKNRIVLESKFNLRKDRADRLYTVLNIPEDYFEEPYNLRTSDIDSISEKYVREYINNLSVFLNSNGLSELYDFYEPIKKVSKYSYLIVLGFKPFDTVKFNKLIWFRAVPIISFIFLILIFYFLFR
jgi:hypothetical protein